MYKRQERFKSTGRWISSLLVRPADAPDLFTEFLLQNSGGGAVYSVRPPVKEIFMFLWSASSIEKRFSLLGVLAASVWLLTGTPANGQAATAPAASTATAKKTIQAAQERLLALGYQPGAADGVMGAKAIAALKKFQVDHSLPVSGQLDQKTLDVLNDTTGSAMKPAGCLLYTSRCV